MATDRLRKKIGVGRHASSIKRDRQNEKHNARNRHARSTMRTIIKKVRQELTLDTLKASTPVIAKAAKKGLIHRRKASRMISRLTKAVNKENAS